MKYSIFILLFLSACAQNSQFEAYNKTLCDRQNEIVRQGNRNVRQDWIHLTKVQEVEKTKRAAIRENSGYPFVKNNEKTGARKYKLPVECTEERNCSDCDDNPERDEMCRQMEKLFMELNSKYSGQQGEPINQPGVVIVANGAVFTGNNFFAPGATARGDQTHGKRSMQPKVQVMPKIPESDNQTLTRFAFGWLNNLTNKVAQVAPIGLMAWLGVEAVNQPNNYVGGDSIGGDDNTGRGDYVSKPVSYAPGDE